MKKETKKFIDYVNEFSKDCPNIVDGAINDSKFHSGLLGQYGWTPRKILNSYKNDLMHKWNFMNDLVYEGKIDLKKVDFWDIMDYFKDLGNIED